jgi:hypothetical protein
MKEAAMDTYPQDYDSRNSIETVLSAIIAATLIVGLLWGLVELSQSRGATAEHLTTAERECAYLPYSKDREACIKQSIHAGRGTED